METNLEQTMPEVLTLEQATLRICCLEKKIESMRKTIDMQQEQFTCVRDCIEVQQKSISTAIEAIADIVDILEKKTFGVPDIKAKLAADKIIADAAYEQQKGGETNA